MIQLHDLRPEKLQKTRDERLSFLKGSSFERANNSQFKMIIINKYITLDLKKYIVYMKFY